MTEETTLYESHESMFRWHPGQFIVSVLLCAVGIGIIILIVWYLRASATRLIVTDRRVILRKGLLSKFTSEIRHEDVSNIQINQTFGQRLWGIGSIGISSDAQNDVEINVDGIRDPQRVSDLINEAQNARAQAGPPAGKGAAQKHE